MKKCTKCGGTGYVQDDAMLGGELKAQRVKVDISLLEVSCRMKISPAYLCDLEHGRRAWSRKLEQNYRQAIESK
jgi:transcriptional regulator with XRE-family HTH domain